MSQFPLDQFVTGTGLLYAIVVALALVGLIIRGFSKDPVVRRRALLVVGLLLIFVILRVALAEIPPRSRGSSARRRAAFRAWSPIPASRSSAC